MKYYYLDEYDASSGQAVIYTEKVDGLNKDHKVLIEKPKTVYGVYNYKRDDMYEPTILIQMFVDKSDAIEFCKKCNEEADSYDGYLFKELSIK